MRCYLVCFGFFALLLEFGCASSSSSEELVVNPTNPVVKVGERMTLSVESQEPLAGEPRWEIQELHGGGFLNSGGPQVTYIAPSSAGLYHVVIRGKKSDGTLLKQVAEVRVQAILTVDPPSTQLARGATYTFAARIKGLPRATVTWSVDESEGGFVTPAGLYTAPFQPGTYHVVATSTEDPDVSGFATVQVVE